MNDVNAYVQVISWSAAVMGAFYLLHRWDSHRTKPAATDFSTNAVQSSPCGPSGGNFAETIPASYIITVIDTVDGQLIGLSMPDNRKNAGHSFPSSAPTVIRGFLSNDERTKLGEKINELVVRAKLEANV